MSRHYIVLPAKIDAQIDGQARKLTSATIICGFDKFPTRHFFCNVSESLIPEHVDEPIWASVLDFNLDNVTSVNGFDSKLASMGVTLPASYKDALLSDWSQGRMKNEVHWNPDGTIDGVVS